MVGIKGLGGIPEPKSERPAKVRDEKARDVGRAEQAKDDLLISSEAQAAASIAKTLQDIQATPGVRADRVAVARQHIEQGDYKRPEVVAKVAAKISKYLP